jgi:hypothetical protein
VAFGVKESSYRGVPAQSLVVLGLVAAVVGGVVGAILAVVFDSAVGDLSVVVGAAFFCIGLVVLSRPHGRREAP